jgi:hypothetical protein
LGKLIPVLDVGVFPISTAVRLQSRLLLKNAQSGLAR